MPLFKNEFHNYLKFAVPRLVGASAPMLLVFTSLSFLIILFVPMSPSSASGAELGSVLVLGADFFDPGFIANSYRSGFIVKMDETRNAAYVLTAKSKEETADRLYVLYDPLSFPFEMVYDLETGIIPSGLKSTLMENGHPEPTSVRRGIPPHKGEKPIRNAAYFQTESFVLGGAGREYLALPQAEHLLVFHLLPATLIQQSDDEPGIALLVIYNFPHYENNPVLYMDTPETIDQGASIVISGCNCGQDEGINQAELPTQVDSLEPGILNYSSALVNPGFSGGPILLGDYVVAMNFPQEKGSSDGNQARLASSFKEMVDQWIGLSRMKIDLEIASPKGAQDGIVSTDQKFTMRSRASLDPLGQVLAPIARIELVLPDLYQSQSDLSGLLEVGKEKEWDIISPSLITEPQPLKLIVHMPNPTPLVVQQVATEEGTVLQGKLVHSPPNEATFFIQEDFNVALKFEQTGAPVTSLSSEISLKVPHGVIEEKNERITQTIDPDQTMRWDLRAQNICWNTPISFVANANGLDRNDKPIKIILPDPLKIRVNGEKKAKTFIGIGRILRQGEWAVELELGYRFRVANVLQKGFPLMFGFSAGAGIDSLKFENVSAAGVTDEALVIDYRYWAGLGASLGIRAVEISADVGTMQFRRGVSTVVDSQLHGLSKPATQTLYFQTGLEFKLLGSLGMFLGTRQFLGPDEREYLIQARFRFGK